ncbi:polyphosphate--glucose phosphotransferase [Bifidobacterium crudilactis]|jgi:polyphosphate glucokinase|uniref:polyphosphate--glucose phosphotransferase n=1 Tax=Bifidobacterium crudilactis TaxID=327277 RepID=UPI00054D8A88|nr:ROK family protein [Bifidobacterium crudilactis]MCI1218386.1 ROK family protein [Bifidobacterium crudilactis]MCI1636675.1 ROK family protein [Bifidobacterium crudilactis]MCI1663934.1 ROK family protein [Bifidobacterium crudilactis]MCI2148784.1 ROK family protein [Bifidobacterium crudilactis]MCI2158080.1 ROK family protein [Bifidobacterium crudilactis]
MIETAQAFGIDIGGSGIKGAPVDLNIGDFAEPRLKILTPEESTPEAVGAITKQMLEHFEVPDDVPVGIAFPAPIKPGKPLDFMANLDKSWLGVDVQAAFSEACGRPVKLVNDADAAGLAEVQFGAAKGENGLVIATTLGTGIGTAIIYDGVLVPNSELGHLTLKDQDAEKYAAASVREQKNLGYKKWAGRLTKYYGLLETYLNPDLFVVGGGVSRMSEKFLPLIDIKTPIVPAKLRNQAGIVGAAYFASIHQD